MTTGKKRGGTVIVTHIEEQLPPPTPIIECGSEGTVLKVSTGTVAAPPAEAACSFGCETVDLLPFFTRTGKRVCNRCGLRIVKYHAQHVASTEANNPPSNSAFETPLTVEMASGSSRRSSLQSWQTKLVHEAGSQICFLCDSMERTDWDCHDKETGKRICYACIKMIAEFFPHDGNKSSNTARRKAADSLPSRERNQPKDTKKQICAGDDAIGIEVISHKNVGVWKPISKRAYMILTEDIDLDLWVNGREVKQAPDASTCDKLYPAELTMLIYYMMHPNCPKKPHNTYEQRHRTESSISSGLTMFKRLVKKVDRGRKFLKGPSSETTIETGMKVFAPPPNFTFCIRRLPKVK